jgi:signal transduction histidine kinase
MERGLFHINWGSGNPGVSGVPRVERFAGGRGLPDRFRRVNTAEWAGEPIIFVDTEPRPFRFDAGQRRFVPFAGTEPWPAGVCGAGGLISGGSVDERGALWLASGGEVYQAPPGGGPPRRLPHLAVAAAGAVSRLSEEPGRGGGVLWICGTNGLARVEVARAFPASTPLTIVLGATGVREGDCLAPGSAAPKLDYVALRHQIADSVSYQTRLAGYERDWSPWSPVRNRVLGNLPPGAYRFEVRARDADGVLSATAALAFRVLAPWWQTPWALAGYAVLCSCLVAGFVRLRTRALHERAGRLEVVVAERTAELAEKNVELTRLNRLEFDEKVAARLAEEKARLEVLRYQLNPHFLYNTLASISGSLPAGRSAARAMVERLAEFCRLTLHRADAGGWSTLGAEMVLLRTYLEIERSRWGELLAVEIVSEPALDAERFPHFLLLPLVENALKFGRATSPDRVALRLTAGRAGNGELVIEVSNTGEWVEPGAGRNVASLGIGLDNLRERLARYYPRSHRLEFSHADGWVTVVLRIQPPAIT